MLQFEGVTKRYPDGREALRDVTFRLRHGEFAFLTGPSGAGKSTLLRLIPLIERPSRGRIVVHGKDVADLRDRHIPALRRDIGMIFQDFKLISDRTVFENVALPLVASGAYTGTEISHRVHAALDKVGLRGRETDYPLALSAGEQQRVGISRAVVGRPALLLADEPTGNLDPTLAQEIMQLFEQFNRAGVTVLIATHDVSLVYRSTHRVLTLDHGRLEDGAELENDDYRIEHYQ